jgi:Relaxase/Mobilisation nuclease domain.
MSIIIRFDNPIQTESHLRKAISYIMKEEKARGRTYSNSGIIPEQILDTFLLTKEMNPSHGTREGYHLKLSFSREETISHDEALEFVKEWTDGYLCEDYDYVVAEHSDGEYTHMHLIFNSVKRSEGKYHYDNKEWKKVVTPLTNRICRKYGTGLLKEKDKKLDYSTTKDWKEGKWDPVRCRRISYQQMSDYQKYFVRRAYQARRLYGRTNTTLKLHEQSVRAVNRMMRELALIYRYDIRSERDLSEKIGKLEKQEECREERKDLKKIQGSQKEIRQERKVKGHDQRTKQQTAVHSEAPQHYTKK